MTGALDIYLTESQHQEQVILWCDHEAPVLIRRQTAQILAISNGGHRNKAVAGRLKAEGVRAGVPDLFLPVPAGPFHGLWIELKKMGGRPSAEQIQRLAELRANGYRAVIAVGWREAVAIISDYLGQP